MPAACDRARRRERPLVERIVVLRAFAVLVVVAFLALVVHAAIRAFGTSEQQSLRLERAVDRGAGSEVPSRPR